MLFLDGVYVERPDGWVRFRWVKAPTSIEITQLADRIARRVGRFLERHGLLERDAQHSYLAGETLETDPMDQLLGHSITYRIAVGPQQGRKVFTLQTLPAWDDSFGEEVGKVAGLQPACRGDRRRPMNARSLNGCAATSAAQRCRRNACRLRRMATFATSSRRPNRDGTTHVIFQPLDFIARLAALVPKPRVNLTRFARIIPDTRPLRGPAKAVQIYSR